MSERVTYDDALEYIAEQLTEHFQDEPKKAIYWLMTENPMLGNIVPAWLMLANPHGPRKLRNFVRDCKEGNLP